MRYLSLHINHSLCMCICVLTALVEKATIVLIFISLPFLFARGQVYICISVFLSSLLGSIDLFLHSFTSTH